MDKMQRKFESWAVTVGLCLRKLPTGCYACREARIAYEAWKNSRLDAVVSLPDWSEYDTPKQGIDAVKDRLDSLGIKWIEP